VVCEPSAGLADTFASGVGRVLCPLETLDDPQLCYHGFPPQTLLLWPQALELVF
jgi:hypothetical protein